MVVRIVPVQIGIDGVGMRVQLAVMIGPEVETNRDRGDRGSQPCGHDEGRNRTDDEPEHAGIVPEAPHPVNARVIGGEGLAAGETVIGHTIEP
jgi:hypothetical protein